MRKVAGFIVVLVLTISLFNINTNIAAENELIEEYCAEQLYEMGILLGTDEGLELNRDITRIESVIILVRLLGLEEEALAHQGKEHTFEDVPPWGEKYLNYAYKEGLAKGITPTEFGSYETIEKAAYLTFLLRALGYDDAEGDFNWREASKKALEIDLIDLGDTYTTDIDRGLASKVAFNSLNLTIKGEDKTLLTKLVEEQDLSIWEAKAVDPGIAVKVEESDNDEVTRDEVHVPGGLIDSSNINNPELIEGFMYEHMGKTIIFPANQTFIFDSPVELYGLSDTVIDFNSSTVKLQNDFKGWEGDDRHSGSEWVGNAAVTCVNSSNLIIKNLKVDGNRHNMNNDVRTFGVFVGNASDIKFVGLNVQDVNFHGVTVYTNTKGIHFEDLYVKDNFGAVNCADIYVHNKSSDNVSFNNVLAERSSRDGYQVYYIDGYNSRITNLTVKGASVGVDYRRGNHYAENLYFEDVDATIHMQTVDDIDIPQLTVKNVVGKDIHAGTNTRGGLGIWAARNSTFENVDLTFSESASTASWGVIIKRFSSYDVVENVVFRNLTVRNTRVAAVLFKNLNKTNYVEGLRVEANGGAALRAEETTAFQQIHIVSSNTDLIRDEKGVLRVRY